MDSASIFFKLFVEIRSFRYRRKFSASKFSSLDKNVHFFSINEIFKIKASVEQFSAKWKKKILITGLFRMIRKILKFYQFKVFLFKTGYQ